MPKSREKGRSYIETDTLKVRETNDEFGKKIAGRSWKDFGSKRNEQFGRQPVTLKRRIIDINKLLRIDERERMGKIYMEGLKNE